MKEGLSVGLVVGMSGGGEGMFGGRPCLYVTRTPSGILWTSWLGAEWKTKKKRKENLTPLFNKI